MAEEVAEEKTEKALERDIWLLPLMNQQGEPITPEQGEILQELISTLRNDYLALYAGSRYASFIASYALEHDVAPPGLTEPPYHSEYSALDLNVPWKADLNKKMMMEAFPGFGFRLVDKKTHSEDYDSITQQIWEHEYFRIKIRQCSSLRTPMYKDLFIRQLVEENLYGTYSKADLQAAWRGHAGTIKSLAHDNKLPW